MNTKEGMNSSLKSYALSRAIKCNPTHTQTRFSSRGQDAVVLHKTQCSLCRSHMKEGGQEGHMQVLLLIYSQGKQLIDIFNLDQFVEAEIIFCGGFPQRENFLF